MINKDKYQKLNIKQKVYKVASSIRALEHKIKNDESYSFETLENYQKYLKDEPSHPKIDPTKLLLDELLNTLPNLEKSQKLEKLNFAYHNLLGIFHEQIGEKFFDVRVFDNTHEKQIFPLVAILDNLRSPFNIGSVFRSSESFGFSEIALCGISPTPDSLKVQRTAMGTESLVSWKYFETTKKAISYYKNLGYKICALETAYNASSLLDFKPNGKNAFVFGNEEFGITSETLAHCDQILEIPLIGHKNSINVSHSFSITAYHCLSFYLRS